MLATFGLGRLEAGLDDDTVSPADVIAFLEQAKADCAKPAARAETETYESVDHGSTDGYRERIADDPAEGLPVRVLIHRASNPDFRPTRHAYRV